ncbi:MAG TPA: DUF4388 domain-containing protein [Polyangiaceae bacterium]|nr:DUF4388 domain-containing protein [Polyangiaceae bacterium]
MSSPAYPDPRPERASQAPPSSAPRSAGFSANLEGASLADLVQMACQSGLQSVARIRSAEQVGYLYFSQGRLVHAVSPNSVGDEAALEILSWQAGRFEPCGIEPSAHVTIQSSYQSLLMRAAHARDERARGEPGRTDSAPRKVITLPPPRPRETAASMPEVRDGSPREPSKTMPSLRDDERNEEARAESRLSSAERPRGGPRNTAAKATVRLDAEGNLRFAQGSGTEELAQVAALVTRLGNLVGRALGLDRLHAVEGTTASGRTLIVIEKQGEVIGVRTGPEDDVSTFRKTYGL